MYSPVARKDTPGVRSGSLDSLRAEQGHAPDSPDEDDDELTAYERSRLRKVPDKLPWTVFLVAIVELCERFAYYGLSGPFNNYINYSYHDPTGLPGALGLGQAGATALTNFFQFWCYLTPILGAVAADQYLGKYRTIYWFSIIYMVGIVILFLSSLPSSIEAGLALGGLLVAMVVIGLGTGGIKANVAPLIAEQYTRTESFVRTNPNGERVIVEPTLTVQRIYMIFYLMINIGSLSTIVTTPMEKYVGFWAAYLLPLAMFIIGFFILISGRKSYVDRPPKGSVVADSFKAIWIGISNGGLDAAKPSRGKPHLPWDDAFVNELKRTLVACQVFLFFPIYWLCFNQMMNNFISQAGQMELHGIPNDMLGNLDPITIIIFIPICDKYFYPFLRKRGIAFKPMTRIFWGFLLAGCGMAYAALVQHIIYTSPPCYEAPGQCPAGAQPDGSQVPNHVNVVIQAPAYLFIGLSEILASVTGLEYAYTKAPESMKSFIMSLFLLTSALGAALGGLIAPFARDPNLVGFYGWLAIATFSSGIAFWVLFRKFNALEDAAPDGRTNGRRGSHEMLRMGRMNNGRNHEDRGNEDEEEGILETDRLRARVSAEMMR
ncbi:peptide transporter ptr2 [Orbilia ellipsospora]|uniref:Peptide transporter ptr2 n=1 Tax=Orbilia ellipsospora TaxID=2528407 RepID=A0AAV9WXB0_9PEZI